VIAQFCNVGSKARVWNNRRPRFLSLYLYPMNAIGKPCCACIASWQLEAQLFHFYSASAQTRGNTRSTPQYVFRPVPSRGRLCAARREALAPAFTFFFLCNVTFRSPSQVNKVCIVILNSVGKSIYARHGPVVKNHLKRCVPAFHGREKGCIFIQIR
jgi:hypothetical protein